MAKIGVRASDCCSMMSSVISVCLAEVSGVGVPGCMMARILRAWSRKEGEVQHGGLRRGTGMGAMMHAITHVHMLVSRLHCWQLWIDT